MGHLYSFDKSECFGCESCSQVCPKSAITFQEDDEAFRYPKVNKDLCINCGLCHKVCPQEHMPKFSDKEKYVFGGYHKIPAIRQRSTSGGAFTALAEKWLKDGGIVFGATAKGLTVYHTYVSEVGDLPALCKSKYSQSIIGNSYKQVKDFLQKGEKVLFSGTPCHIAGLRAFLEDKYFENLFLVEVVCEGNPSPLFIRKFDFYLEKKYGAKIEKLDYRYKGNESHLKIPFFKWDFQVMHASLQNHKVWNKDRWFNPFWSVWLKHLISRPSCYKCPFAKAERLADVTLGDLWGVHIYCPELYGKNGGASLVLCNTEKGRRLWKQSEPLMFGHELDFETALKYQGPLRKHIDSNEQRNVCISDLKKMDYQDFCKKWASKPTCKLLFQKYIWGNRQKVFLWNLLNTTKTKRK